MRGTTAIAIAILIGATLVARADYTTALEAWTHGDYPTALREWLVLANQGDPDSQFRVARMYHHGEGGHDDAAALRWYREAAEQGHEGAQNNLGLLFEEGRGAARDLAEAAKWYRRAADQGFESGEANLARMYDQGLGVPADPVEAARWYKRAAESGHAHSQYKLGQLYEEGRGVPQDSKKAARWYRHAARKGQLEALDALGRTAPKPAPEAEPESAPEEASVAAAVPEPIKPVSPPTEEPVPEAEPTPPPSPPAPPLSPPPSPPPATDEPREPSPSPTQIQSEIDALRRRAEGNDAEAQYDLAMRYNSGQGVARSLAEASRWFLEAAGQGHPMAAYRLALTYMRGWSSSADKDYVQAHRWFSFAAEHGVGDAATWRDRLAKDMTADELAESARLSKENR